ncbi:hypothetical protein [Flammeovirga sp. EKP202]|uniref:hypothetical protein n=1 Tax=Flammeovirga sp. EKP202 TaxID=2770592 RepID=UPI00165FA1F1|nr:hypothetical protein [Flammeovirga sp. EKP202]MBD0404303.1 hypothetical protein [Flammeovirga sp. EKP202]
MRLNYVNDHLELYYKLIEIAKKLDLCLIGEEVLLFVPDYGILYDPEDPEESISYEILVDELEEKLNNGYNSIVEIINSIIEDKKAEELNTNQFKGRIENFNSSYTPKTKKDEMNYTKHIVIFGIVLLITYFFVI